MVYEIYTNKIEVNADESQISKNNIEVNSEEDSCKSSLDIFFNFIYAPTQITVELKFKPVQENENIWGPDKKEDELKIII